MVNGTIIEKTDIAVDFWRVRKYPWVKYFFLSHVHSDHTEGLTPSWRQKIYCSEMSKKLLMHIIGVNECLIETIEIGSPKLFTSKKGSFVVTLMDANHCPGSVMFLFEGDFGRILYTADFRCDANFFQSFLTLPIGSIDTLYLDNTYFLAGANFPSREEATMQVVKVIEEHPRHRVVIVCYRIGKEDLLVKIALHFKEWIIVSMERYKILEILGVPNVFTTEEKVGRIRVIVAKELKNRSIQTWIRSIPTVAIFPTGLFNQNNNPYRSQSWEKSFFVPYSDHSSFQELQGFLRYLKPDKVVPIIKDTNTRFLKNTNSVSKQLLASSIGIEADSILDMDSYKGFCEYAVPMKPAQADSLKRKKYRPNRQRTSFKVATQRKGVIFDDDKETGVIAQEEMTLGRSKGNEVIHEAATETLYFADQSFTKTLHVADQAPANPLHVTNQSPIDPLDGTAQSLSEVLDFVDHASPDTIPTVNLSPSNNLHSIEQVQTDIPIGGDQAATDAIQATEYISTRQGIDDIQNNEVERDADPCHIDDKVEGAGWNSVDSGACSYDLQSFGCDSVTCQNSISTFSPNDTIDSIYNKSVFSKHLSPAASNTKRKNCYKDRYPTDIRIVANGANADTMNAADYIRRRGSIGDIQNNQIEQNTDIFKIDDDGDEDAGWNGVDSNEHCCSLQSFSCKRTSGLSLEDVLDCIGEQDTDVCQIDDTVEHVDLNCVDSNELKSLCSGSKSSNCESSNSQYSIGNLSLKDAIDYIYNDSVFSRHMSSASSDARRKKNYEDRLKILSTASAAGLEVLHSKSSSHSKT